MKRVGARRWRSHNDPHPMTYDAWAVAAPGLEPLLEAELRALGFADATSSPGGVSFACDGAWLISR